MASPEKAPSVSIARSSQENPYLFVPSPISVIRPARKEAPVAEPRGLVPAARENLVVLGHDALDPVVRDEVRGLVGASDVRVLAEPALVCEVPGEPR